LKQYFLDPKTRHFCFPVVIKMRTAMFTPFRFSKYPIPSRSTQWFVML